MFVFMRKSICFFSTRNFGANHASPRQFTTSNSFYFPATYSGEVTKAADKDPNDKLDTAPDDSVSEGNPPSKEMSDKMSESLDGDKEAQHAEDYSFSPNSQDFMLENVDPEYLKKRCHNIWFVSIPDNPRYNYLETAEVLPKKLPVRGAISALNRLWINLVCQAQRASTKDGKSQYGPARNVTFLVDPCSPYTYLSKQAMESLAPDLKPVPGKLEIQFHPAQIGVDKVYMSPEKSHFPDANILGNNILNCSKMELFIHYRRGYFEILETANDKAEGGLK